MFLNDTLFVLMYTANMMATLPNETKNEPTIAPSLSKQSLLTTTLSPEEKENKFDFEDGNLFLIFISTIL